MSACKINSHVISLTVIMMNDNTVAKSGICILFSCGCGISEEGKHPE